MALKKGLVRNAVNYSLLQAYKNKFGNLQVMQKFIVPSTPDWSKEFHGKNLGSYTTSIRQNLKRGAFSPEDTEKLIEMGFVRNIRDEQDKILVRAFEHYKQLNGHCDITNSFQVPKNDETWPSEYWGLCLGKTMQKMKYRKNHSSIHRQLEYLGYDMSEEIQFAKPINLYMFEAFRKNFGHLNIPINYVIPSTPEWPKKAHNRNLGLHVESIRNHIKNSTSDYKECDLKALKELGFQFAPPGREVQEEKILHAFREYKERFGHCEVPLDFKISCQDEQWSEQSLGVNLGVVLQNIQTQQVHTDIHDKLVELGVDIGEQVDVKMVCDALSAYQTIHSRDLEVPYLFTVPHESTQYPKHTWGLKIGQILRKIQTKNYLSQHRKQFIFVGVVFETMKIARTTFPVVCSALEAYKNIHGDLRVSYKYVIARGDSAFPASTWGMKLGNTCQDINKEKSFKKHRDKLMQIGFVFRLPPAVNKIAENTNFNSSFNFKSNSVSDINTETGSSSGSTDKIKAHRRSRTKKVVVEKVEVEYDFELEEFD